MPDRESNETRSRNEVSSTEDLERSLHSRYNPRAEAVRYIDSLQLKSTIECFILIEPGFGYIIPALREKFKTSRIIILHAENFLSENILNENNLKTDCAVFSGSKTSELKIFLEKEIPDIENEYIKIIEWRPSMNYFKEAYLFLLSQTVEFLKQIDAGRRTTALFGKRWFKNFFKNTVNIKNIVSYRKTNTEVIITGSGPSLEEAIPKIKNAEDYCLIIAASSSVMALSSAGITPDIIISTDGGNWARRHLEFLARDDTKKKTKTFLAINLNAALPSQINEHPFLIINDGSIWQNIILQKLLIPSVLIGQRGTVSATAIELAMMISNNNIYLAGMDFSNNDIRTHVKPYAFDALFFAQSNRFLPVYSNAFKRSLLMKEGGSMKIYETWFKDHSSSWQNRIFSITDHSIFAKAIPKKMTKKKIFTDIFSIMEINKDAEQFDKRIENCKNAIFSAIDNIDYEKNIKQELTSLLFSSNSRNITKEDLKNKILEVVK